MVPVSATTATALVLAAWHPLKCNKNSLAMVLFLTKDTNLDYPRAGMDLNFPRGVENGVVAK